MTKVITSEERYDLCDFELSPEVTLTKESFVFGESKVEISMDSGL